MGTWVEYARASSVVRIPYSEAIEGKGYELFTCLAYLLW